MEEQSLESLRREITELRLKAQQIENIPEKEDLYLVFQSQLATLLQKEERLASVFRRVLDEVLAERDVGQSQPRPKGFSEVGSAEADSIIKELKLQELSGNELDPITVPEDDPQCSEFDFARFGSEDLGLAALMDYHKDQLQKRQVKFGRGGFSIYDTHSLEQIYSMRTPSGRAYHGNVDCIVAPFGMEKTSAPREARIIFEHKQNDEQKAEYRRRQGLPPLSSTLEQGPVTYAAKRKGQSVASTLAAYAHNTYPLMYDLTDGQVHHLLRLQGSDLYVWRGLTSREAYYKMAEELLVVPVYNRRLEDIKDRPELEDLLDKAPNKRLCTALLGNVGALKDQLDGVVPWLPEAERLEFTMQMMETWSRAADSAS